MARLQHDCAMATAKSVLDMVGHLLRPEEQREFFGMVYEAVSACLVRHDELRRAGRQRLGKPVPDDHRLAGGDEG